MPVPGALLSLGLILAAGMVCGVIARALRLPTLTGYLGAGILLGHHGFDLLEHAPMEELSRPINDLAMALVLFVLGGQFRMDRLRSVGRKTLGVSLVETAITFVLVSILTLPVIGKFSGSALLGVMAVAVAPATTIVILREYRASGPTTSSIKLLTALSNVWAVLFFEIALLILVFHSGAEASPLDVLWDVGGALLFGLVAGHALIVMQHRVGHANYSIPLLSVLLLTIGAAQSSGVPHMLTFLVTGAVVVNRSRFFEPITNSMDVFAQPAYVAFFVLSGWHLDFAVLTANWQAVGLYVLSRTVGKILGARAGLRFAGLRVSKLSDKTSPPVGLGLLCQAGAAIALAQLATTYDPVLGNELLQIILGAVVVFELVGPILVRYVAVAAGEVRMAQLMTHADADDGPSLMAAVRRGLRGGHQSKAEITSLTVERIMRTRVAPLREKDGMDEILRHANHSPFNQLPVVTEEGRLTGMIRLHDLDDLVYDPRAAALVIAGDLTAMAPEESSLPATATVQEAGEFFQAFRGNTAAVVQDRESGIFMGMVERAEVLRLLRTLQKRSSATRP